MKFINIILKEGRKEDLKKKYSDKYDEEVLDWILNISDLVDFNHKYTDFVLRTIDPKTQDVAWWVDTTIDELKLFDKYQNQLVKKDINQYENFNQLQDAISPIQQREKEKELEKEVDVVYDDDKVLVVKPKTKESSCKYGRGTKWCTAATQNNRFDTYTSGNQSLYYIILKNAPQELGYKIAVHFANSGKMSLWDDQDNMLSDRETKLVMTQVRPIFNAILGDRKNNEVSNFEKIVTDAFDLRKDTYGEVRIRNEHLYPPFKIYVVLSGMDFLPDMGDRADAKLSIRYSYEDYLYDSSILLDEYLVYISYGVQEDKLYLDVILDDNSIDPNVIDLGLSGEEYVFREPYNSSSSALRIQISKQIIENVYHSLRSDNRLSEFFKEKMKDQPKMWRYDRFSGYKFSENKGMIKKLVDWLDSESIGTKLQFLTDIGKLKRKIVNGKSVYSREGEDDYSPSSKWRGHFASFFSAAKSAGILNYRKVGTQYYLTKGPNFDDFKEGNLKAV